MPVVVVLEEASDFSVIRFQLFHISVPSSALKFLLFLLRTQVLIFLP